MREYNKLKNSISSITEISNDLEYNIDLLSLVEIEDDENLLHEVESPIISLSDKALASELFSSKFLNINLIWNEGIAFGLFSFDQHYLYNFLT